MTRNQEELMIRELIIELKGKIDGGGKNIVSDCPFCGGKGKFGIYIGKEAGRKKKFSYNCFKGCSSGRDITYLLEHLNRLDLLPDKTSNINDDVEVKKLFDKENELSEVDDELFITDLPEEYIRTYRNKYLKSRGVSRFDYEYFEVGTSVNFKFSDYVIFPVYDDGDVVGYVSRHIWSKEKLTKHNKRAKLSGDYMMLRYRNSKDNDFVKLLYNIDNVIQDETKTVILLEGIFDVISVTRVLQLYNNPHITAVATFGKKLSDVQMYKLQQKGVKNVVIGYDSDAVNTIKKISSDLDKFFNCLIVDVFDGDRDFGDFDFWEMFDLFTKHLRTPIEYNLSRVQSKKLNI